MPQTGTSTTAPNHNIGNTTSDPEGSGRGRLPDCDPSNNGYIVNCIHKDRPLTLNDIARPVFMNHYYTGESLIPVTSKKLIRLDECDVSTENSVRNPQPHGACHKSREALQDSRRMPTPNKNTGPPLLDKERQRGFHSEFVE